MQNTNLLSAMIEKTWNVHHIETHLALRFLYSRLNWVNNIQPNLYEQNRSHGRWGHNLGKIYSKSFVFSWAIAYLMVNHLSIEKYFIGCVLVFNFWGKCDTMSLLWTTKKYLCEVDYAFFGVFHVFIGVLCCSSIAILLGGLISGEGGLTGWLTAFLR